jgi:hypothetical protein
VFGQNAGGRTAPSISGAFGFLGVFDDHEPANVLLHERLGGLQDSSGLRDRDDVMAFAAKDLMDLQSDLLETGTIITGSM